MGSKPIKGPLDKKQSWSSAVFTGHLQALLHLLFAWSLNCLCDSSTHGVTLGYYLWLPLPWLSEPLSHCWAGCQLQAGKFCKALTQTHISIWTLSGVHTNIHAYKYGHARIQKRSATFVDTNGDNVVLLKVRSGEIRVGALHWQSDL